MVQFTSYSRMWLNIQLLNSNFTHSKNFGENLKPNQTRGNDVIKLYWVHIRPWTNLVQGWNVNFMDQLKTFDDAPTWLRKVLIKKELKHEFLNILNDWYNSLWNISNLDKYLSY